jgi:hypothetical protein
MKTILKLFQNFEQKKKFFLINWLIFAIILTVVQYKSKYEISIPLLETQDIFFSIYKDPELKLLFEFQENESDDTTLKMSNSITDFNDGQAKLASDLEFLNIVNLNFIKEEYKNGFTLKFNNEFRIMPGTGKVLNSVYLTVTHKNEIKKEKLTNIVNTISDNIQKVFTNVKIIEFNKLMNEIEKQIVNNNYKLRNIQSINFENNKDNVGLFIALAKIKSDIEIANKNLVKFTKNLDDLKNINKRIDFFNLDNVRVVKKINKVNIFTANLIIFIIFFCLNLLLILINRNSKYFLKVKIF